MAAPDVVGRGLADILDGSDGVAHAHDYPTLDAGCARGRPAYIPARRLDAGLRLDAPRIARKEEDEPDEVIPLADPEPEDEDGGEEEDEAEDDKET